MAAPAAANPIQDFKNQATQGVLKPFARDFGGLLGASDFHSARVSGLGGFDVGILGSVQFKPSRDNVALKNTGVQAFGVPLLRVEAGLPLRLGVFLRGVSAYGATLIGGGVRYQIYKSGLIMAIPDIAVTVGYDTLRHSILDLNHLGGSIQASFNIPVIKPFAGFGYDSTQIKVAEPAALAGLKATATGTRLTLGVSMTPFPFSYIFGAYSLMHGESGAQFGVGARFGGL